MLHSEKRYKAWRLFNRQTSIELPKPIFHINLSESYEAANLNEVGDTSDLQLCAISCSFAPDDAQIICTEATFSHYINTYVPGRRIPCGFISLWEINDEEAEDCGCMFTYSPVPNPKFSPCGNKLCAVMNGYQGQLSVIGYNIEDDIKCFSSSCLPCLGGNLCGRTICVVLNNYQAVTITDIKMQNNLSDCNLSIWKISNNFVLKHRWTKKLLDICDDALLGICLQDCCFSPDSNNLGLLMSNGLFILVDIHLQTKKLKANLKASFNLQAAVAHSHKIVFSFHKKYGYRTIAVGCSSKILITDITNENSETLCFHLPESEDIVTHLSYSNNGRYLAVSCNTGCVYVYSCLTKYSLLFRIYDNELVGDEQVIANCAEFSSSSEELVVAYSNGIVNVWQLPRIINLKEICRLKVLSLWQRDDINFIEVPKSLKQYLYFEPDFK